jgi:hypothetical protein
MMLLLKAAAVLGVVIILLRAGGALFSLLRGGLDIFLARDLHEVRSQRGDLTGMQEAAALSKAGRTRRALAAARLCAWLVLLIIPGFTPWPTAMRAAYCIFWLFPRPVRMRIGVRGSSMKVS